MIGYVTIGTNDIERAARFYDELLKEVGAGRFMSTESLIAWSSSPAAPALAVTKPFDGNAATVGNGVMVALQMDSAASVDAFHKRAMELGASDEGEPGPRGDNFYAGYFRDLDGNKLAAFKMG